MTNLLNDITAWSTGGSDSVFNSDVTVGGNSAYRIREGVERFMISDINNAAASSMAQSEIWVMADEVTETAQNMNHVPGGGNVLFMDGHVEFIKYPGDLPVCRGWAFIAANLSSMP
jgi:prepilin-type processing-associated H-X9-DG protein